MKISCIIVEDEPASQEVLKKYVADCPVLELVAICGNALEAQDVMRKHPVDLIFLDINMPKISGIQFYKSLSHQPAVIFTTAYPEYALEGFEVNAIDYLLKPFPFERFLKAINKLTDKLKPDEKGLEQKTLFLYSDKKIHKIWVDDILFMEAKGDYLKVVFPEKNILIHETMQSFLDQLPGDRFVRVHKSYAICLDKIDYLEGNMIKIKDITIPIGQAYRQELMKVINKRKVG